MAVRICPLATELVKPMVTLAVVSVTIRWPSGVGVPFHVHSTGGCGGACRAPGAAETLAGAMDALVGAELLAAGVPVRPRPPHPLANTNAAQPSTHRDVRTRDTSQHQTHDNATSLHSERAHSPL